jgi:hypothetical protein
MAWESVSLRTGVEESPPLTRTGVLMDDHENAG